MTEKLAKYSILGVDPGTNAMGYAILEVEGKQLRLLKMSVITLSHLDEQQLKLKRIFERVSEVITQFEPKQMAIEAPFYSKNVQAMLKLGRAQGVAIAAAITNGVEMTEYLPKKVKQSVTGNGNASKEQVAAMLAQILKQDINADFLDATDALAVAVCHYYQSSSILGGSKTHNNWSSFLKENNNRIIK
jgi:crossover junction endodeoxyribonuclease RuvC